MSAPLNTVTQKPIEYSTFSFGGDDTKLGHDGLFGKLAKWDRKSSPESLKAHFVFFAKKAFAFLDFIGIGTCFYGIGGFTTKLDECIFYQGAPARNREAREKIVNALGGKEVCEIIPIVQLNRTDLTDYLRLGDRYFKSGEWIVQGEDLAGRKFILLRLADKVSGQIQTLTIHQRYRETSASISLGGRTWVANFSNDRQDTFVDTVGSVSIPQYIEQIRTGRARDFAIAMKP